MNRIVTVPALILLMGFSQLQGADAPAGASLASVRAAAQSGQNPERLSPLMAPKPWDPEAFAANPQAYIDTIEPGRAFQHAEPGPQVPTLAIAGPDTFFMVPGGNVTLTVRTRPRGVASFTSFSLGQFQNGLTSITVRANEEGLASAVFTATRGTVNGVNILVGSPMATGNVHIALMVRDPNAGG